MGGLEEMKKRNEEKAKILYDFLDSSKLFKGTVVKEDRSLMNVPFLTKYTGEEADAINKKFVENFSFIIAVFIVVPVTLDAGHRGPISPQR